MASRREVAHVVKAQPVPLSTSPILMGKRNKLCISEREKFPLGETIKPALMSGELPEPVQGGHGLCTALTSAAPLSKAGLEKPEVRPAAGQARWPGGTVRSPVLQVPPGLRPCWHSVRSPRLE